MNLFLSALLLLPNLQTDYWKTLESTELIRSYDEFLNQEVDLPVFSKEVIMLEGQKISVSGYIIPIENSTDASYFVLSRFPFQSCFFCGAAGPETVIEVYAKVENLQMDKRITVEGTLFLNQNDPLHLFFMLKDAKVIQY